MRRAKCKEEKLREEKNHNIRILHFNTNQLSLHSQSQLNIEMFGGGHHQVLEDLVLVLQPTIHHLEAEPEPEPLQLTLGHHHLDQLIQTQQVVVSLVATPIPQQGLVHPMHLVLALIQILHRHLEVILEVDSLVPRPTGPVHLRLVSNNNNNNNNHSKLHLRLGLPTIQDLFWVISYWRWFIW